MTAHRVVWGRILLAGAVDRTAGSKAPSRAEAVPSAATWLGTRMKRVAKGVLTAATDRRRGKAALPPGLDDPRSFVSCAAVTFQDGFTGVAVTTPHVAALRTPFAPCTTRGALPHVRRQVSVTVRAEYAVGTRMKRVAKGVLTAATDRRRGKAALPPGLDDPR